MMNIVDSSGWLEYFCDGENAGFFAPAVEDTGNLLIPAICLYEVFKRIIQMQDVQHAQTLVSDMLAGQVIAIDESIALNATRISLDLKLAMADSLILACARTHSALLWTQDVHFRGISGVKWVQKSA